MDPMFERLKPFWYPVLPLKQLGETPIPVMLLGHSLVLWRGIDGQLGVLDNRCRHRSAPLSDGHVGAEGSVHCPYHGWAFDTQGRCRLIPQQPGQVIHERCHTRAYQVQAQHGLVWVCLVEEARLPIPSLPGLGERYQRRIDGYQEPWQCSAFRVIENALDNYHHHFVHQGLLDAVSPIPPVMEDGITVGSDGFVFSSHVTFSSTAELERNVADHRPSLKVGRNVRWLAPLGSTLELTWPNGLQQCIVLFAVPREVGSCTILRFYLRNDREEDLDSTSVIAFDRAVVEQDRRMIESLRTDLDPWPSGEQLIEADQPIGRMRQLLQKFLATSS